MSLFPTLTLTPQQFLDNTVAQYRATIYNDFTAIIQVQNNWYSMFFENFFFTPQQVADALSANGDAVHLLEHMRSLRMFVVSAAATEGIPLSGFASRLFYPLSAYAVNGNTITFIPSAYSGP